MRLYVNRKMKNILPSICQRLWRIRTESGLTDVEIVRLSGKSHAWWHRLKHGANTPFVSSIVTVADKLGIKYDWIKTGEGPEPNWKQFQIDMKLRSEMENKTYRNVANEMRQAGIAVRDGTAAVCSPDGTMPLLLDAPMLQALDRIALYIGIPRDQFLAKIDQWKAEHKPKK